MQSKYWRKVMKNIINFTRDAILKAGAEKAECILFKKEKHELNVASGEISLFRSTYDNNLNLNGFLDAKKGSITINKLDDEAIIAAAEQAMVLARSSKADEANDIAEYQPSQEFNSGLEKADLDKMYFRLNEFMEYTRKKYPTTIIEEINFDFSRTTKYYCNSNGVDFTENRGLYSFVVMFTSKEGRKTSSFNYTAFLSKDLDKPFQECGSVDRLLRQSGEQLELRSVPEKFVGDIIVTPDCMDFVTDNIVSYLSTYPLIIGTSVYKDKLDQKIASPSLTLRSNPVSDELAFNYHVTGDGYVAENNKIVDKGILKTFVLGLYGSNKTGLPKSVNRGDCYVIDPGNRKFEELISSMERGLLLCRFSGGNPSDNGDFSGVAKNSYYIENGKIMYPVNETMVSGNLVEMLENVAAISSETVNLGYIKSPWIKFKGVTVSGK
jgi:PmbA protein